MRRSAIQFSEGDEGEKSKVQKSMPKEIGREATAIGFSHQKKKKKKQTGAQNNRNEQGEGRGHGGYEKKVSRWRIRRTRVAGLDERLKNWRGGRESRRFLGKRTESRRKAEEKIGATPVRFQGADARPDNFIVERLHETMPLGMKLSRRRDSSPFWTFGD